MLLIDVGAICRSPIGGRYGGEMVGTAHQTMTLFGERLETPSHLRPRSGVSVERPGLSPFHIFEYTKD